MILNKNLQSRQEITRRTFLLGIGKMSLLSLLASRMFYMQFLKKDEYRTLSDQNRIKTIILLPARGEIIDVNGKVIAKNTSCFRLLLDKTQPNFAAELKFLAKLLSLETQQIAEIDKRVKKASPILPVIILDYIDWPVVAAIEEHKHVFQALFIDTGFSRTFYLPNSIAHIIGYLGRSQKVEQGRLQLIDQSFKTGQQGIEKFYEQKLRGEFGFKNIEVNAKGKYVRDLGNQASIKGSNLSLNIDIDLQNEIFHYLNPQGCSAIIMDVANGALCACVSTPGFDPNQFNRLSSRYWQELISNPYKPLINKIVSNLYPPGSIFKIITILAALEAGINPAHQVYCSGGAVLGGNRFRCARRFGHGYLNMLDAFKYSCNSYIYTVAEKIGAEKIIEVARRFGFGRVTAIDLPGEKAGFVPSPDWKKAKYGSKWTIGDTLNLAIGQGFLLVTPIQLARLLASIAADGKLFTPQLAYSVPKYEQIAIKEEYLLFMQKALAAAMNSPGATGYLSRLNFASAQLVGKTGTAQVQAKKNVQDNLSRQNIAWASRNHAIFSGYLSIKQQPRYAISVYYDHGGGGGRAAAPIAKKIAQTILKKYHQ